MKFCLLAVLVTLNQIKTAHTWANGYDASICATSDLQPPDTRAANTPEQSPFSLHVASQRYAAGPGTSVKGMSMYFSAALVEQRKQTVCHKCQNLLFCHLRLNGQVLTERKRHSGSVSLPRSGLAYEYVSAE